MHACSSLRRAARRLAPALRALAAFESTSTRASTIKQYTAEFGPAYPRFATTGDYLSVFQVKKAFGHLAAGEWLSGTTVQVTGRIISKRVMGSGLNFYDILNNDHVIQVMSSATRSALGRAAFSKIHEHYRKGDIIAVTGFPGRTKTGELTVQETGSSLLVPCLHDIPLQLKDPELRVRERHLDLLVNPDMIARLRLRAKVIASLREFLTSHAFVEVETPILSSTYGGARARPFFTRGTAAAGDLALRIAPELYLKQLVVGGLERVFEIGKQFRNEGVDATHNPEFTTCEFYIAYRGIDELMALTEATLRHVVQGACGTMAVPMTFDDRECMVDFAMPFRRLSFTAAVEQRCGKLPDLTNPDCVSALVDYCRQNGVSTAGPQSAAALLDRLGSKFVEPLCEQPTFVTDLPALLSPLAKRVDPASALSARFELFIGGREYCNAYEELNDPAEQRARFREQAAARADGDEEAALPDEGFCRALEYGLPPTAGWGLGIDRLVMLLAGVSHLRDVLAFPFVRPKEA